MDIVPTHPIYQATFNWLHILGIDALKSYEFRVRQVETEYYLELYIWEGEGQNIIKPVDSTISFVNKLSDCIDLTESSHQKYDEENSFNGLRKVTIVMPIRELMLHYAYEQYVVIEPRFPNRDSFVVYKEPVPDSWSFNIDKTNYPINIMGWHIPVTYDLYREMIFNSYQNIKNAFEGNTETPIANDENNIPGDNIEEQLRNLKILLEKKINK